MKDGTWHGRCLYTAAHNRQMTEQCDVGLGRRFGKLIAPPSDACCWLHKVAPAETGKSLMSQKQTSVAYSGASGVGATRWVAGEFRRANTILNATRLCLYPG